VYNRRLAEAEAAITSSRANHRSRSSSLLDEIVAEFGDLASFVLRLLANVYWYETLSCFYVREPSIASYNAY